MDNYLTSHDYTGQLIISMPYTSDLRFSEVVIFICGHDHNGAMGLILNRPLHNITFKDFLEQIGLEGKDDFKDTPIMFGGPVDSSRGFVIHSNDYEHESTIKITKEIFLTATLEMIDLISKGHGPKNHMIALGYAGWEAGQLEQEIQENQWLIVEGKKEFLFQKNFDKMWREALSILHINPDTLSFEVGHA